MAGMLVDAQVAGVLANGVRLVFCGYFEGTASCECLGVASSSCSPPPRSPRDCPFPQPPDPTCLSPATPSPKPPHPRSTPRLVLAGPRRFATGTKVVARILWVQPSTKAIGLALGKHLIACESFAPALLPATPLRSTVEAVFNSGALVSMTRPAAADATAADENHHPAAHKDRNGETVAAWLAKSSIADLKERQTAADALKRLEPGSAFRAMVVGCRWLEGSSLQFAVLEVRVQRALRHDISSGMRRHD